MHSGGQDLNFLAYHNIDVLLAFVALNLLIFILIKKCCCGTSSNKKPSQDDRNGKKFK